jgi:hypothetical protein
MAPYGENSAKDLIARFIDSIGIRDEKGIVPFVRSWPEIAGPDLAAHSQVLDIRNGAVLVGLDHPAWLQRMHLERSRIVRQVQQRFPSLEVRYLHMTVVDKLDPAVTLKEEPKAAPEDEKAAENEHDGTIGSETAEKAADDTEFLKKLQSLEEAIRRKNGDVD